MTSACRASSPLSNPSNTNITFMNQKYLHTEPWVHWSPSDNVKFHIFLLPQQSHGLCKQLGSARHSCASRVSFRRPVCHLLDTVWQIKKNVVSESCSHIGADQRDTWRICLCVWSGVWCRGTRSVTSIVPPNLPGTLIRGGQIWYLDIGIWLVVIVVAHWKGLALPHRLVSAVRQCPLIPGDVRPLLRTLPSANADDSTH